MFFYSYITMLGEVEFLDVWNEAYAAVMKYTRGADGYWVDWLSLFGHTHLTDSDADSQHVQGHILDH